MQNDIIETLKKYSQDHVVKKLCSDELTKELQKYVKDNTAPYKYPRLVEFHESLPKTTSGKIIRKLL